MFTLTEEGVVNYVRVRIKKVHLIFLSSVLFTVSVYEHGIGAVDICVCLFLFLMSPIVDSTKKTKTKILLRTISELRQIPKNTVT